MYVQEGNKVEVQYVGALEDGSVFDSSEAHGNAVQIVVGAGATIPGLEKALVGMQTGETKEFTLTPEEGYGYPDLQLRKEISREQFPQGQELKPGVIVGISHPNGQQFPATVVEVTEKTVLLDLNHPLSGKNLHFKVKVVAIGS